MTCKHNNKDYGHARFTLHGDHHSAHEVGNTVHASSVRCLDCKALLSAGHSDESPPDVAVEIQAATIGSAIGQGLVQMEPWPAPLGNINGWLEHSRGEPPGYDYMNLVGWLAREIAVGPSLRCEDLTAFVDGELDADEADAFRAHLAFCESCSVNSVSEIQLSSQISTLAPRIEPLPETERCVDCGATCRAEHLIEAGWALIDGVWHCADHLPVVVNGESAAEVPDLHHDQTQPMSPIDPNDALDEEGVS